MLVERQGQGGCDAAGGAERIAPGREEWQCPSATAADSGEGAGEFTEPLGASHMPCL